MDETSSMSPDDEIRFYIECCVILMIFIFIMTKLVTSKITENSEISKSGEIVINKRIQTDFIQTFDKETQTEIKEEITTCKKDDQNTIDLKDEVIRSLKECVDEFKLKKPQILNDYLDDEVIELVRLKLVPIYKLENYFTNPVRGIKLR